MRLIFLSGSSPYPVAVQSHKRQEPLQAHLLVCLLSHLPFPSLIFFNSPFKLLTCFHSLMFCSYNPSKIPLYSMSSLLTDFSSRSKHSVTFCNCEWSCFCDIGNSANGINLTSSCNAYLVCSIKVSGELNPFAPEVNLASIYTVCVFL